MFYGILFLLALYFLWKIKINSKILQENTNRNGGLGKAGVYVFTNKINGFCYVGSSIQLANRLTHDYLENKNLNLREKKIKKNLK